MSHTHAQNKWPTVDGLRVGHLNINSAINKLHEIELLLHNHGSPFHMFGITESRITDKVLDADIAIPGYITIKRIPRNKLETGVIAYVSTTLNFARCYQFEKYGVECIWLEVKLKHSAPLLIGFIYRNPDERVDWIDNFSSMIDAVTLQSKEYILLGDFNIDLSKVNDSWLDTISQCNLSQLVKTPTRSTCTSETLIDHIYTTNPEHMSEVCVPPFGCSDHFPVCFTWRKKGIKVPKAGHKTIFFRSFKNFNEADFLTDLSTSCIGLVYNITDPDEAITYWHKHFISIYNKHAPLQKKRVKHFNKPAWLDQELQEAIKLRDYLKRHKQEKDFKTQRNKVTKMKRSKMKEYFNKLIDGKQSSKKIWEIINTLTNKQRTSQPSVNLPTKNLNQHFTTVADRLITNDRSIENTLDNLRLFCNSKDIKNALHIPFMTVAEVYKRLTELKDSSTRGLDGIDNKILKLSAPLIADSLTYIYNLCIDKSYFPSFFKQARVIPLHKSGPTNDPNNYRPISILSALSKPFERHIHSHMLNHLTRYDLLHSSQSGFRPNHSCHTALVSMVEKWLNNINDNTFTAALFIDFAKAFDLIDHSLLVRKLELYNLEANCAQLLSSFISDRCQSVSTSLKTSDPLPI